MGREKKENRMERESRKRSRYEIIDERKVRCLSEWIKPWKKRIEGAAVHARNINHEQRKSECGEEGITKNRPS